MPKAKHTPTTPVPSMCVLLGMEARYAEACYLRTLRRIPDAPGRPSGAKDRQLDRYADERKAACRALALTPAPDLADWQAKARVLLDAAVHSNNCPPIVHDADGLVFSLLQDLIGATPSAA